MTRPEANPYRWSLVDPDLFYGRQDAAASLLERLLAGDRFAVAGGRRMGKTTLLSWLERALGQVGNDGGLRVVPVFVDVAELSLLPSSDAYRLLGRRVAEVARAGGTDAGLGALDAGAPDGPAFADGLRELLDASRRLGRLQLVFLFDEIERIHVPDWGGGFLAHWRRLLNNMGELSRHVSAVFCGAREIYRIAQDAGSPLGNILAWQELEPFSLDETARLMREPSRYPWPDTAVARVFEVSGGQPCLIQFLMQALCTADVERWEQTLAEAERRFLDENATMFASWWQSFEDPAQELYARIRAGDPVAEGELIARYPGQGKRALDVLSHTGVIRWDRTARTVQAAGSLFRIWAEENPLSRLAIADQSLQVQIGGPGAPDQRLQRRPADREPVLDPSRFGGGARSGLGTGRRIGTILFTDIVNSTAIVAERGDDGWLDLKHAHHDRVRQQLAIFDGREINEMGDGFLALFDAPTVAIRCARAIHDAVGPLGLQVRAGLHAGEYDADRDTVSGIAIQYASWVISLADAGEVLVSETVRGLMGGSGIRLVDLGEHLVKGTTDEYHRVYAVDADPESPLP